MTAQAHERIIIDGEEYGMAAEPLAPFLKERNVKLIYPSTALWRGYLGKWTIIKNKLYLLSADFYTENGALGLEYLFKYRNPVFASWFTGDICIVDGELLNYVHGGYLSTYETEIFFHFYKGLLTNRTVVNNTMKKFNNSNVSFDGEF